MSKYVFDGIYYRNFKNASKLLDKLPAGYYEVRYTKSSGFLLEQHEPFIVTEKQYGTRPKDISHVLKAFNTVQNRNLGVLLTGKKGLGKTLFAKMLAVKAVEEGYPVIIVNEYFYGISEFIQNIAQDVVLLFDEFEKTHDTTSSQQALLSLLDGTAVGKKMFILTCNYINRIDSLIVNRPGRCHYQLRFESPSLSEITEYLNEQLPENRKDILPQVATYADMIHASYDVLRAFVFELSLTDEPWLSAFSRLNTPDMEKIPMEFLLKMKETDVLYRTSDCLLTKRQRQFITLSATGCPGIKVEFMLRDIKTDNALKKMEVKNTDIRVFLPDGEIATEEYADLIILRNGDNRLEYRESHENNLDCEEEPSPFTNIPDDLEQSLPFT